MFFIEFNDISNLDLAIHVIQRPSIPIPKKKFNEIDVDEYDGIAYEDLETYEDLEIQVNFNFLVDDIKDIRKVVKRVKNWLKQTPEDTLCFSDNKDYFYKVKKVVISNFTYENLYEIQNFNVTFTCDPWEYVIDGKEKRILNDYLENFYSTSKPIYTVIGNGECLLTVNGNECFLKVENSININCESGLIYYDNGEYCTSNVKLEEFSDLYLTEGTNKFSITNGFNAYIIPNFRSI